MTQTRMPGLATTAAHHPLCRSTPIETLLRASARGDESAFSSFYEQTSPLVFSRVLRTLPDRPAAETAMVAVYTTLWRRAAEFGLSACSAWSWTLGVVGEVMADTAAVASPPIRPRPLA